MVSASDWHDSPKQEKLGDLISKNKIILAYGGSRSGKTARFCQSIIYRAYDRPSRHAILRFHFSDVKQSVVMDTLPKVFKLMGVPYKLNKSDWFFTVPCKDGTGVSEIWACGLDDNERVDKILGKEYSTIYFNEASQISYVAYTTAVTRLAENSGLNNKIYIDCNPPEKSHWLYQLFMLKKQPGTQQDIKFPEMYASILMNPQDNPHLKQDYIDNFLETLPDRQRRRFLYGEWLDKRQGALWDYEIIERYRVTTAPSYLTYAGVAIDPAVTSTENSDETGIVWGGMDTTGHIYIMGDLSTKGSPFKWATIANNIYNEQRLDFIGAETNQGGDMVENTIRGVNQYANYIGVRATRGKALRAEPVVAMYEQGKVHHVGNLPELEEQLIEWSPEDSESPDRLDALVWLITILIQKGKVSGLRPNEPTSPSNRIMPNNYGRMTNGLNRPPTFGSGWNR